jgi:hypothetical protein
MDAKQSSPTYEAYMRKYATTNAYELEAMKPGDLAEELDEAIQKVLDIDLFNEELAQEEQDSGQIVAVRRQVEEYLKDLNLDKET